MTDSSGREAIRISVVVPTFNRAESLARCLAALAGQSLDSRVYEVIVVDDGSADRTEAVCTRARAAIRNFLVYRQANRGPAAARNAGIRLASGEIVAFTDDDCVPPRDWLEKVLQRFDRERELVGLGGVMVTPADDWVPLSHHSDVTAVGQGGASRFIGTNNAAYRRGALLEAGGFDEGFRHVSVEDADLYIRVRRLGVTALDETIYVWHPARLTGLMEAVRGFIRFYRGYLALQKKYPEEFKELYGTAPESLVLMGRDWRGRARRYTRGMIRHPLRGAMFIVYLVLSRGAVVWLWLTRQRRANALG
ncbi:MAG TPA: glycosyltransferase family A protein [Vicinamibacterales bacterium]|nr:glycosyltransferase family A protein [Vicinamibacterales bacterium]